MDEFAGSGMDGSGVYPDSAATGEPARAEIAADFPAFVRGLVEDRHPETPRLEGWVPCTYLWLVEDGEFIGSLAVRHALTDFLFEQGGHIGYSIRPSARRRGHAAHTLRDARPVARELGITRLLLTCAEDNTGSRAVRPSGLQAPGKPSRGHQGGSRCGSDASRASTSSSSPAAHCSNQQA